MGKQAIALGHIGLLLGMMGLMLLIVGVYVAVAPYSNPWGGIFFSFLAWGLGVVFAVGEWFELKREA